MAKILTVTPNPALDIYTETETLFDDKKMYCSELQFYPGGGGINFSRVASRLQAHSKALFFYGGHSGAKLCSLLRQENIDMDPIETEALTREVFNVWINYTGKIYRFVTPGGALNTELEQRMLAKIDEQAKGYDYVVGSGSLPPGCSVDFYAKVATVAQKNGVKFVLDTSNEPLLKTSEITPYMMRMNSKEFEWLKEKMKVGNMSDLEFEKLLLEKKLCQVVVHTLGQDGAIWADEKNRYHVKPPAIKVKSSVGAGDSFLSALLIALADGYSTLESLKRGMAAAVATLITPGTELCTFEEYQRRIKEIVEV